MTTTSRTRPTWSPSGSKTLSSVRRPTKARVGVLTGTGYRGEAPGRAPRGRGQGAGVAAGAGPAAPVPGPPAGWSPPAAGRTGAGAGPVGVGPGALDEPAVGGEQVDGARLPPPLGGVTHGVEPLGPQHLDRGVPPGVLGGDLAGRRVHGDQPAAGVLAAQDAARPRRAARAAAARPDRTRRRPRGRCPGRRRRRARRARPGGCRRRAAAPRAGPTCWRPRGSAG